MEKIDVLSKIAEEFSKLDYVDAVVLSGSQTGLIKDKDSDYDIYIYAKQSVPLDFRRELAQKFTDKAEIGNTFFEDGDELDIQSPQMGVDLMYRRLEWIDSEIDWVWKKHNAKLGYTTAVLHNIRMSQILFDRNGEFQKIIDELNQPFPEELKKNIIAKNYPILKLKRASFYDQIELAVKRNDLLSQNHRITALLTSYFDILFAINSQTHPGEKKLVQYTKMLCPIIPREFKEDVEKVVKSVGTDEMLPALNKMLDELDILLH